MMPIPPPPMRPIVCPKCRQTLRTRSGSVPAHQCRGGQPEQWPPENVAPLKT